MKREGEEKLKNTKRVKGILKKVKNIQGRG